MSWKGIVKAVDRAGTSLMQKTGAMEKTVDKDFDDEERRFRNLEGKVEKLYKEAKGYLDSVRAMTVAQQRMAETINMFYDDTSPLARIGDKYKDVGSDLDQKVRMAMDEDFRKAVLEPLTRYHDFFPTVNDVIKRRQKKLLDYDMHRSRVRKLAERPSEDTDKLPKAEKQCAEAKQLYMDINQQLIEELPKLVDVRVPYLDPSFEALIKCQIQFSSDAYEKLGEMKVEMERAGLRQTSHSTADGRVESVLQQLRELTIVGRE